MVQNSKIAPCATWRYAVNDHVLKAEAIAERKEGESHALLLKIRELEMERGVWAWIGCRWDDFIDKNKKQ